MADDDLLIKLPEPPQKPVPGVRSAQIRSNVAIVVSIVAVCIAGLQWNEAHQNRLSAHAPLLEITKAEFVGPSTLFLTLHNIGHAPALSLRGKNDAFIGWVGILRSEYSKVFVRAVGYYAPSIPVARDAQVGAYMPEDEDIRKVQTEKRYPSPIVLELRGQVVYSDDNGRTYALPYCYVAMRVKPLPVAAECAEAYDDIVRKLK